MKMLRRIFKSGKKELCKAASEGDLKKIKKLISEGVNVNSIVDNLSPLHYAVDKGQMEAVRLLFEHDAKAEPVEHYLTPLWAALWSNHTDVALLLLEKGANVNAETVGGCAILHDAVFNKRLDIVEFLVNHGASVNVAGRSNLRVFGNRRGSPQDLVVSMCKSLVTIQIKPEASEEAGQIFYPITTALEYFDFVVQSFDPAAR